MARRFYLLGRRAPILFPIVGRLVDNTYYVDGKPYSLTQHGFARDLTFSVQEQSETKITYIVTSNEETLKNTHTNSNYSFLMS